MKGNITLLLFIIPLVLSYLLVVFLLLPGLIWGIRDLSYLTKHDLLYTAIFILVLIWLHRRDG